MAPKKDTTINLLDTVIILVLAFTIDLFILWIAAQLRGRDLFEQLPPWLAQMSSSVWSWGTGAAGTIVLGWLRRRTASNAATPNYLAWAGGGAVLILVAVAAVSSMVPPLPPPPDSRDITRFDLKVQMRAMTGDPSRVAFQQRQPRVRSRENIALQPDGTYYKATADFPKRCEQFQANIYPVADNSEMAGPSAPTSVVFFRSPKDPQADATEVIVECDLGNRCAISPVDLGWALPDNSACKSAFDRPGLTFGGVLHAQAPQVREQSGWRVPSLATLGAMKDRGGVGYTRFSITSDSLKSLGPVDSFMYLIRVNGTPVYVDGARPEDMLEPVTATGRFVFEFGLENLNFSGSDNGCERIDVSLQFRNGNRTVRGVTLTRKYAALRDADALTVAADGLSFVWSARHIKPPDGRGDHFEVFVASGASAAVTRTKTRLDAAGLRFRESRIVGVTRPPLNNPQYGLLAGLAQPSGQIKFMFDAATAKALMGAINAARTTGAVAQAIQNPPFLYELKTGDSGTGTMKACGE